MQVRRVAVANCGNVISANLVLLVVKRLAYVADELHSEREASVSNVSPYDHHCAHDLEMQQSHG